MTTPLNLAPSEKKMICIDNSQGRLMQNYLSGLLDEAAALCFEEHLVLCFYCQDEAFKWDAIQDALAKMEPSGVAYSQITSPKRVKR
jgi:anti-sigma factor RsiW